MAKKIKLTEEQYNSLIKEGITLNADVAAANGDVKQAIDTTKKEAQQNGVNLNNATIQIPGNTTNENRLITKKTLVENRLKVLKQHSEFYSFKDFLKK